MAGWIQWGERRAQIDVWMLKRRMTIDGWIHWEKEEEEADHGWIYWRESKALWVSGCFRVGWLWMGDYTGKKKSTDE